MLPKVEQKRDVYLDHAATTPVSDEVLHAMLPYWQSEYGNPSALYDAGQRAKRAVAAARDTIATHLQCSPQEIVFTPGGTASDNLAILGLYRAHRAKAHHFVTTTIEHHAVLRPMQYLEKKEGGSVTLVPVDGDGIVSVDAIASAIRPETLLVSVMYANNEIGTIQPIAAIGSMIRRLNKERALKKLPRVYFHTDACQAAGALSLDVTELGVDLLTLNASKMYGPKGIGILYVARGVQLDPLLLGGGQERGLVSGTEQVGSIVGLATALDAAQRSREEENARLRDLRDILIRGILDRVPKSRLNGHAEHRLPNNVNITILDVEGEAMLLYLNEYGIACATGSACDSETLDPSHVILALGLPYEFAHGSLRFTLGKSTTKEDIDYVLELLPPIVSTLRDISPVKLELNPDENTHAKILQHGPAGR